MKPEPAVNILLVDDNPKNLLALEGVLDAPGYRLVKAHSGDQALKSILHQEFAMILLDVEMPGLDGFETAKLIKAREKSRQIPIIFMSAIHKAQAHLFKGYSAGAIDYLFTPYDPSLLRSKVAFFVELFNRGEQIKWQNDRLQESERKQLIEAEEARRRYHSLAEAMPLIVWTARPDGAIDYINQRWFAYTGMTFEETKEWGWTKALHPDDLQKCMDRLAESIRIGGGGDIRCRLRSKEGGYCWHMIQAVPERNLAGEIIAWLGTSVEIHDESQEEKTQEEKRKSSP